MIVKAKLKKDFVQIANDTMRDPSLSWAARGLLAYLLTNAPTWEPHLTNLFTRGPDGRRATERAMNELIAAGYVVKEQGENKRRNTKYTVYETPALCPKRTQ